MSRRYRGRAVGRALLIASTIIVGLLGWAVTQAGADDGGPRAPQGGWPKPTPTTVTETVTRTQPAETVTQTVTQTRTATETQTRTRTKTAPPPPVWTEPNLPVTGARPGVVAWAGGAGLLLIAAGAGLLLWRRRRDRSAIGVA